LILHQMVDQATWDVPQPTPGGGNFSEEKELQ
jgi:hypothetical protein